MPGRLGERADTPGGPHDERLRQAGLAAARRQRAEVVGENGPEVGVHGCRRRAFVLPELRRHLVRRDHVRGRQAAAHLLGDEPLVRRVAEGEEQADGDGLRVQVGQRVEIERLDDPVRPDALVDADAAIERNERVRMVVAEAVEMRTRLAAQVEDVLEAGGADERGPGPRR